MSDAARSGGSGHVCARRSDETDRNVPIVTTTNDRIGAQGSFAARFEGVRADGEEDRCGPPDATIFHVGRLAARQVEPRQSPSFFNAVFNYRNLWDNRANSLFNGVGTFGMRRVDSVSRAGADPSPIRHLPADSRHVLQYASSWEVLTR